MNAGPLASGDGGKTALITILLVDDIPETRENIKKLLAFESDMTVIGGANTGREGVDMAKELKPDIIIMDINMPDMDGLQATSLINKVVPQSAVIIMSVQDDVDYMRRAMLAGARDFLAKPVNIDDLTNTIRTVYRNHEAIRRQYAMSMMATPADALKQAQKSEGISGERAGHIIVVYSPQGGTGVTTIATGLATSLMRKGIRVLLADGDLSFGDVGTFLAVQPQATVLELVPDADDLDPEHFDNIVTTHASGLKVLAAPPRPEMAEEIRSKRPGVVAQILTKVRANYDYIVVDTATALDEVNLTLFDVSDRILLVTTPSLPSVKNSRFILDLFDKLGYEPDRTQTVLNKVYSERDRKGSTLETSRIQQFLKRPILIEIPVVDERILMGAVLKGVPITIAERDKSKAPVKQLSDLAERLSDMLAGTGSDDASDSAETTDKKGGGLFRLGGR
jgi:pilus assembly protein CpaE